MKLSKSLRYEISEKVSIEKFKDKIEKAIKNLREVMLAEYLKKTVLLSSIPEEYRRFIEPMDKIHVSYTIGYRKSWNIELVEPLAKPQVGFSSWIETVCNEAKTLADLEDEMDQLQMDTVNILTALSTYKQVEEVVPELSKYLPILSNGSNALVPIAAIAKLRAQLQGKENE